MTDPLPTAASAPDPFDLAALRLPQDFAAAAGVRKLLTAVPIGKPTKEAFFRVRPGDDHRVHTSVLELKGDRDTYLVSPRLRPELAGEPLVQSRLIVTTVTKQGALSLWPLRLPGPDGKLDPWGLTALDAAREAESNWVRLTANQPVGMYDVHVATGDLGEPAWPDKNFQDLLRIAFRGKVIDSIDHPVLRRLRGEI